MYYRLASVKKTAQLTYFIKAENFLIRVVTLKRKKVFIVTLLLHSII